MCSFPLSWRGLMGERARVIRPLCFSDLLYFLWLSRYHTGLVFPLPFSTPFLCPHCRLLHDLNRTSQASVWSSFSSYTTTLFGVRVCWGAGSGNSIHFQSPQIYLPSSDLSFGVQSHGHMLHRHIHFSVSNSICWITLSSSHLLPLDASSSVED